MRPVQCGLLLAVRGSFMKASVADRSESPDSGSFAPEEESLLSNAARWRILAVLLTAIFMSLIAVSIVNVAIPSIQSGLDASLSDMQWVLSGYALTFGVVLVAAGRAGDIYGRGGLFLIGVALFTLTSIAAGLAPDAKWLNVARFLQGAGSGLINPQGLGMIQQYFRGEERGRAFGFLGTAVGVSVAIGPVLGGLLIQLGGPELGWRLTFLVNLPFGILTLILGWRWFPRPLFQHRGKPAAGQHQHARRGLRSLDPIGGILLGLAVLAVLFPFVESRDAPLTWLLLPGGLLLCWAWVLWERGHARRGHRPMVDLNIFRTPSFRNGTIIVTLYFLGMTSIWVLVAVYVQEGRGMSALESGLFGVPGALLSAWAAHWAGGRVARLGRRVVIGGLITALIGLMLCILVIWMHEQGWISIWWLLGSLAVVGIAQGAIISPNQALTLADVPLTYAGSSGAVMQTGQRIGASVGIAVITAAVFSALQFTNWSYAIIIGLGAIMLVVILALWVAIVDLRVRERSGASALGPASPPPVRS